MNQPHFRVVTRWLWFAVCAAAIPFLAVESRSEIIQEAKLQSASIGTGDFLGYRVAISGDTAVVAAFSEDSAARGINGDETDNSASSAGAVFVFVREGDQWTQQAYLKASNADQSDSFGLGLDIDGNTIVVGAPYERSKSQRVNQGQQDNSGSTVGAAYVFQRSGKRWRQVAYLKASNAESGDEFGSAVSVSGNVILVGAPGEDSFSRTVNEGADQNGANGSGAAYVFRKRGARWVQEAYLKAENGSTSDQFGYTVDLVGETAVIGAPGEDSDANGINGNSGDNSAPGAGAAYVFNRTNRIWAQSDYLKAHNSDEDDRFGFSVAIGGDTIVVGADLESSNETGINPTGFNNSAPQAGAAYVFVRAFHTWRQQAYLKAPNTDADDRFGLGVGVSENGDTVAVGAWKESSDSTEVGGSTANNNAPESGAIYVYHRQNAIWYFQKYLKSSDSSSGDRLGWSTGVSSDTVLGGASAADGSLRGAAYVFTGVGREISSLSKTGQPVPGEANLFFGRPGRAAVSDLADVLFDQRVVGPGSRGGRNHGMFARPYQGAVGPLYLLKDEVDDAGGFPDESVLIRLANPSFNRNYSGPLFEITARGAGLNRTNNRGFLSLDPDPVAVMLVGTPIPELGGAQATHFFEVLQSFDTSLLASPFRLRRDRQSGVSATNDSGVFLSDQDGDTYPDGIIREGDDNPSSGPFEKLLQFAPRAAAGNSQGYVDFQCYTTLSTGRKAPIQSLFYIYYDGTESDFSAFQTDSPPQLGGAEIRTFLGFNQPELNALYRTTLTKSPAGMNEALCLGITGNSDPIFRKGVEFDPAGFPGIKIARIVRFWPVDEEQIVALVLLSGKGVNPANRTALILHQEDGKKLVLLRTGTQAPGFGSEAIQVRSIQAIDLNPGTGAYAILGSLRGVPGNINQALWAGRTRIGDDDFNQHLRLPILRLQKGQSFSTEQTERDTIRSISLRPAPDRTGAGGRGLGQAIGVNDEIAVFVTGSGRAQELLLLDR